MEASKSRASAVVLASPFERNDSGKIAPKIRSMFQQSKKKRRHVPICNTRRLQFETLALLKRLAVGIYRENEHLHHVADRSLRGAHNLLAQRIPHGKGDVERGDAYAWLP